MSNLNLLVISDVHGNYSAIKKFVRSWYPLRTKIDALVISGDYPITTPFSLIMTYMFRSFNLSRTGYSKEVYKGRLRKLFVKHQISSLKKMMKEIKKLDVPIIYIPGNIETFDVLQYMKINYSYINFLDSKSNFNLKNYQFFGLGGSLDHLGIICDHEFSENDFNKSVESLNKYIMHNNDQTKEKIFIFHEPPAFKRNKIDLVHQQKKAKKRGYLYSFLEEAGSKELLNLLKLYKPILSINGHFHEYAGLSEEFNVKIVNPGSLATYQYSLVQIKNKKVESVKFFKIKALPFTFTDFIYQNRSSNLNNLILHG